VGGVRGAVTLAGTLSVPLMLGAQAFPERDLLLFIAAGVILLSLFTACICLPLLLKGMAKGSDENLRAEVRETRRHTAQAAIKALEAEELGESDANAAQAALATEMKAQLMAEYRHQLDIINDSEDAQAQARQMQQLERRLRLAALRAQRRTLYDLRRRREIGDDVVRQLLAELDINEANLGVHR
jgi:prophage tail gpP-like protein